MYVYRIHIKPSGGNDDMTMTFQYCLDNQILGVGYRIPDHDEIQNWDDYHDIAKDIHDELNACKYIHDWVNEGDLVWTRDPKGKYYLARVTSGWEYWMSQEAIEENIDIANIFRCEIREVELDSVPGKIKACFRPRRMIQEIADKKARAYSRYLWNKLSTEPFYEVSLSEYSDIFMLLDDEETEDVVFMYLQTKGYYVVPNSRKKDTMTFEYLLIDSSNFERAWVQVKTGNTNLNRDDYLDHGHKVFLFQSNEDYEGSGSENVTCIPKGELLKFMKLKKLLLPKSIQNKLDMLD